MPTSQPSDLESPEVQIPLIAASLPRADVQVRVEGRQLPVLATQVGAVAHCAVSGAVEVQIEWPHAPRQVIIRPLSRGVPCQVDGRRLTLRLEQPMDLSIECDGDIRQPLFLFAGPLRQESPPDGPGLIRLAAGKVHRFDELRLESGQTLYFEPGAVLEAPIRAADAEGIRILGRGIIDARYRTGPQTDALRFTRCRDILIQDVHILDSYGWTLHPVGCDGVEIDRVRETCWRANCDGIDIESCRDVHVHDCFLYSTDDCIAVKVLDMDILGGRAVGVDRVLIERCTFWNCIGGNAIEIGFELCGTTVQGVRVRDCDVIRVERGACFSIHAGDTAVIRDILIEDVRIEDARDELIDLYVGLSIYSTDCPDAWHRRNGFNLPPEMQDHASGDNAGQWVALPEADRPRYAGGRGRIEDITLRDIQCIGQQLPPSQMIGFDADHGINRVRIDTLTVAGRRISDLSEARIRLHHAQNISLE